MQWWTNRKKYGTLLYDARFVGIRKSRCSVLKIDIMGVLFDNVTMDEAVSRGVELIKERKGAYCVTPNAEIAWEAMHDESFRSIINGSDLVLPDGAGVVMGAKILNRPLKQKVAGIEFADRLAAYLASNQGRLYLLGSKPGVAELAGEKLCWKYPGLVICGTADGYFREEKPVIEKINAAKPDVLFVCLGAPKQEKFMAAHRKELDVGLMIGLGGSLDGFAGNVKRAPKWMIRCNLEWFYRLMKEPKRLGRMMRLPKFVLACKKQRRLEVKNG